MPWAVLLVIGIAAAVGGPLLAFAWSKPFLLGLALTLVIGAYTIALGVDGSVVALSPFGPTQNSRFYGLSNLLETMLLVPALGGRAGSSPLASGGQGSARSRSWRSSTVAGDHFGADGGGAVVLAVGFAVLGVLIAACPSTRARPRIGGRRRPGLSACLAVDAATGERAM